MSLFSLLVAIVYKLICIREKSELVFSENKNLNWMGLFESTANVCNIPTFQRKCYLCSIHISSFLYFITPVNILLEI